MPLNNLAILAAKPRDKAYKLFDGGGLYLYVTTTGTKLWRLKYRFDGRENLISLGHYPAIGLKEARTRRDEERKRLASGIDPSIHRKAEKSARFVSRANSFELVAREWHENQMNKWSPPHARKVITRLEHDIFPKLGQRPLADISSEELLAVLRKMEARGVFESVRRVLQYCTQIFRYAIQTGRAQNNVAADLVGALKAKPPSEHHATITDPPKIGELLRAIDGYSGYPTTLHALQLAPLVFTRPGELRGAEWSEIDLDKKEWRIPAARMKMREPHIVPLSKQAVAIFKRLKPITGHGRLVFLGSKGANRPISENTMNGALRTLGYDHNEMTSHGFRSMASTLLNEQGWNRDAIERQLAHSPRDQVRAAYNYAQFMPERIDMMQKWANYLDSLRNPATVRRKSTK